MDFSKLGQNERLAAYGAIAVIVGGLVGLGAAGLGFLAVAAAVGVLAVVFLPQFSPQTDLPGSKGSLLLVLGGLAAVVLVLGLISVLSALGLFLEVAFLPTLFYLLAVAGGVLMGWAGWQEFQAEGGGFRLGSPARPAPSTDREPTGSETAAVAGTDADAGTHADAATGTDAEAAGEGQERAEARQEPSPRP